MILGSHNSWSYLPPKHWWQRPFAFMAKCQSATIEEQYTLHNVRCFDLRVKFKQGGLQVAHGLMTYDYTDSQLAADLCWLNEQAATEKVYLRVLHEVRNKKGHNGMNITLFQQFCKSIEETYPNLICWCGRNLYDWKFDYNFPTEPSCEELYSSVSYPLYIDDWWPWMYAYIHNNGNIQRGTDKDILLIDFVNIK